MRVKNVRGKTLEIVATGQLVAPGKTVDVPDDLGNSLLEQPANWAKPTTKPKEGDE